jgi:prepilin-type N-terminal cleavage/methylation domain-containing protein
MTIRPTPDNQAGFTLLEIIIVSICLVILAAVIFLFYI